MNISSDAKISTWPERQTDRWEKIQGLTFLCGAGCWSEDVWNKQSTERWHCDPLRGEWGHVINLKCKHMDTQGYICASFFVCVCVCSFDVMNSHSFNWLKHFCSIQNIPWQCSSGLWRLETSVVLTDMPKSFPVVWKWWITALLCGSTEQAKCVEMNQRLQLTLLHTLRQQTTTISWLLLHHVIGHQFLKIARALAQVSTSRLIYSWPHRLPSFSHIFSQDLRPYLLTKITSNHIHLLTNIYLSYIAP